LIFAISLAVIPQLLAQTSIPDWCRPLPRPEYKSIERVPVSDPWFEVYKPAPNVFAIYEPRQAEEVISYLIVGEKRALLFDTGMGISDIKKVTAELAYARRPRRRQLAIRHDLWNVHQLHHEERPRIARRRTG
jgi:hypothetical protein